jgi:phospholipid/cholesterol/gamma-HCH transport system substrate-binding protein
LFIEHSSNNIEKRGAMPLKKKVRLAEMKVGIFVTIALLLLVALILQQSWGINWFSKSAKALTYLTDVGGLKPGAPVWLAGIEIGRVRKVGIVSPEIYPGNKPVLHRIDELKQRMDAVDPKDPSAQKDINDLQDQIRSLKEDIRIVEVYLDIRPQYLDRISKDSEVSIESRGLIGDSFIDITPGSYGVRPSQIGDTYIIESMQHPGFREIMTGANDVVANFGVLSDQFKTIMKKVNPDKTGSEIAKVVQDTQQTIRQINQTFNRASALMNDLNTGKGTFGRIVSDPTLYQRMTESMEKFNSLIDNIQNGKGTVGKLLNDPSLYNSANETISSAHEAFDSAREAINSAHETINSANEAVKKAAQVMDRIEKGEGTLGKLTRDGALYDSVRNATERFAALVDDIDQGNGTLGKLLRDPGLYNNLDQSSSEISKLIYDLRKDPKKYLTIHFRLF